MSAVTGRPAILPRSTAFAPLGRDEGLPQVNSTQAGRVFAQTAVMRLCAASVGAPNTSKML